MKISAERVIANAIGVGENQATTEKELSHLTGLRTEEIRRIIHSLRNTKVIINLRSGGGYFYPSGKDELQRYYDYKAKCVANLIEELDMIRNVMKG